MAGSKRERGRNVWELRVYAGIDPVTGKKRWQTETFRGGPRAADKRLAQLVTEVQGAGGVATKGTFGYLVERWLELVDQHRSPTTAREYRRQWDTRIEATLGSKPLDKLTAEHLDAFYTSLGRSGLGATSINRYHATIRRALNQGVKWGWIATNVALRATPPPEETESREFTPTEAVTALVAKVVEEDVDLGVYALIKAALQTRRGEVCALRWNKLKGRRMTVDRNIVVVGGRVIDKMVKTRKKGERVITLDPMSVAVLGAHRERMKERARIAGVDLADDAYIFSRDPAGHTPFLPDSVSKSWARIRATVPGAEGVQLKDLRSWGASVMLDGGIPVEAVSKRLGHASPIMTEEVYAKALPARDVEAAEIIGRLLYQGLPMAALGMEEDPQAQRKAATSALRQIVDGLSDEDRAALAAILSEPPVLELEAVEDDEAA